MSNTPVEPILVLQTISGTEVVWSCSMNYPKRPSNAKGPVIENDVTALSTVLPLSSLKEKDLNGV